MTWNDSFCGYARVHDTRPLRLRLQPIMLLAGLLLLLGIWSCQALADPAWTEDRRGQRVAVLYPDLNEPYRSVFASIIKGIEEELSSAPLLVPIGTDGLQRLRERLAAEGVGVCIALGRSVVESVEAAGLDMPIVRGAVLDPHINTGGNGSPQGISLAPDPAILLDLLKQLAPRVTRVTVVYSDSDAVPLIARAVQIGHSLGVTVVPDKSEDLLDAAAVYRSVIPTLGPRDALWIPQDPQAVDDKVILPMLLNAAWEQNFVLFSSNADHAKRGVLYSVYPDNLAMGRRLARIASRQAADAQANQGMAPLEDLLIAVNLRAAEHLGLGLSAQQISTFDLTFPQR